MNIQMKKPMIERRTGVLRCGMMGAILSVASPMNASFPAGEWPLATALGEVRSDHTAWQWGVGRKIFNGKGICHYCHGVDRNLEEKPSLSPETAQIVAGLQPNPTDLWRADSLKLKQDGKRFQIIREGHLGTGMLPDSSLSDQEIQDLLAYLAELRGETSSANPPQPKR